LNPVYYEIEFGDSGFFREKLIRLVQKSMPLKLKNILTTRAMLSLQHIITPKTHALIYAIPTKTKKQSPVKSKKIKNKNRFRTLAIKQKHLH